MNYTQLQTTLAPIVAAIAGFLAGKGYFGWDSQTWITVLGALATAGATVWAGVVTRKASMVSSVAAMPEVNKIELDKAAPGSSSLEAATPNNVVSK